MGENRMNADYIYKVVKSAMEQQDKEANERIKEFHPAHKAIIDMAEMLLGGGLSDYVDVPIEILTEQIMLKLYFFAQFDSCLASGDYVDTPEFDERFLTFVRDRGYDITKGQLVERREEAQDFAKLAKALIDLDNSMNKKFEDFK